MSNNTLNQRDYLLSLQNDARRLTPLQPFLRDAGLTLAFGSNNRRQVTEIQSIIDNLGQLSDQQVTEATMKISGQFSQAWTALEAQAPSI